MCPRRCRIEAFLPRVQRRRGSVHSLTLVDNVAAVSLSIYLFISVGVTEKVGNKFTKDGAVGVGMGLVRCWALSCCIFHRAIGHSSDWAVPLAVFGVVAQAPRSPRHLPGPG